MRALVDTNLLVLLIVGSASASYVAAHRRTRAYTDADFDLLCRPLADAAGLVTTPNVLAEASNLIRQCEEPRRSELSEGLRTYIRAATEMHVPAEAAAGSPAYLRLGLTDAALLAAQGSDLTLITDDVDLCLASALAGGRVVNFTHERARFLD